MRGIVHDDLFCDSTIYCVAVSFRRVCGGGNGGCSFPREAAQSEVSDRRTYHRNSQPHSRISFCNCNSNT